MTVEWTDPAADALADIYVEATPADREVIVRRVESINRTRRAAQKETDEKPPKASHEVASEEPEHTQGDQSEPEAGTQGRRDLGRPANVPLPTPEQRAEDAPAVQRERGQ